MTRWIGFACAAAALLWLGAWTGNLFTDEGARQVIGLGEAGWRRLLNPSLLVFALTAWTLRGRVGRLGAVGASVSLAAIGLMLVGNVLEWSVFVGDVWIEYGWGVFIVGGLLAVPGLVLLGVDLVRRYRSATTRAAFAAGTALFVVPLFAITFGAAWLLWGAALARRPT